MKRIESFSSRIEILELNDIVVGCSRIEPKAGCMYAILNELGRTRWACKNYIVVVLQSKFKNVL